jgi:hypothetical protein
MFNRRDAMMRLGQVGLGALTLPQLLQIEKSQAASRRKLPHLVPTEGKAKSCILIYLWGGPPQMDMWDPNPEATEGIRSHFKPIDTVVPGIQIAEEMPLFAKHTDKTCIIRSFSHDSNNHEPSVYRTLTGKIDKSLAVPRNNRSRKNFPNLQSIVSAYTPMSSMPTTVTLPRPIGHDGSTYAGTYAGFLGARHDPMEIAAAEETQEKPTHVMELPKELNNSRLLARRGLLNVIEEQDRRYQSSPIARGMNDFRDQAFSLLSSPKAKNAFDITKVDGKTRDRYGRNEWGESILMAKRLVESGVRLVTISWMYIEKSGNVTNVWDNHGGGIMGAKTGYDLLKQECCLPSLDRGFHSLVEDLSESEMLDETLVAMYGEFGRTPKINKSLGRDHWGAVQSTVLCGGGVKGGQVYGTSDRDSAYPTSKKVSPEDMLATIYYSLGIDSHSEIYDPVGRPYQVVTGGHPLLDIF